MDKMKPIHENLDITYAILKHIIENSIFSPYFIAFIDDNEISITLYDKRLETIEIHRKEKTITANSYKYEIEEVIIQLYPEAEEEIPLEPKWEDPKFIEQIMKKYPDAFKQHLKMEEAAKEISKEYGVKLEKIIDKHGFSYATLTIQLKEWNTKPILKHTKKAIKIFEEYYKRLGWTDLTYIDPYYRKQALKETEEIFQTARLILKKHLKTARQPTQIIISNHSPTTIEITIETQESHKDKIEIQKHNNEYHIKISTTDKTKIEKLLATGNYIKKNETHLKLAKPIKTHLQLMTHLQEILEHTT